MNVKLSEISMSLVSRVAKENNCTVGSAVDAILGAVDGACFGGLMQGLLVPRGRRGPAPAKEPKKKWTEMTPAEKVAEMLARAEKAKTRAERCVALLDQAAAVEAAAVEAAAVEAAAA